jgi:hypothetical protein
MITQYPTRVGYRVSRCVGGGGPTWWLPKPLNNYPKNTNPFITIANQIEQTHWNNPKNETNSSVATSRSSDPSLVWTLSFQASNTNWKRTQVQMDFTTNSDEYLCVTTATLVNWVIYCDSKANCAMILPRGSVSGCTWHQVLTWPQALRIKS